MIGFFQYYPLFLALVAFCSDDTTKDSAVSLAIA